MILYLKNGSGIHIKKKNRGKFTAYCGGNVTSACIARAKRSGNPTLVKRATFAANARKWKHQQGGTILPEVTVVPTRLVLDTYYPVIGRNYRYTGHSSLRARSPEYTVDTSDGFTTVPAKHASINKRPSDSGYNFVTSNCADATRCALETITGKKMNPYFFTTPGDVLDFFKENFDVRKVKSKNIGKKSYYTNITPAQLEMIKEQQQEQVQENRKERKLLARKQKGGKLCLIPRS